MAVKASASITIFYIIDISSVTKYYLLQSSTSASPAKPTDYPPVGWSTTEPDYDPDNDVTSTLYSVECTVFTDDSYRYSDVSKLSSYEMGKAIWNKVSAFGSEIEMLGDKIVSIVADEDGNGTYIEQSDTGVKIYFKTPKTTVPVIDDEGNTVKDADGNEQTTDQYIVDINEMNSSIDSKIDKTAAADTYATRDALKDVEDATNAMSGEVSALQEKTAYISNGVTVDDSGVAHPYTKLGVTNSEFGLKLTDKTIEFCGGTATPARIASDELEIDNAHVTNELGFGDFAWAKRSNGNMGIIWKGGN